MEELKLNSGLKKIAIKDEDGDLITVLSVNVADADTAEHFAQIINNLQEISENCEKEAAELTNCSARERFRASTAILRRMKRHWWSLSRALSR